MNFSGSDSEEDLNEQFAEITKLLNFLLNGRLDFQNVRVKGLTAETIDVQELSAISANLGTITAGLMRAVSIYGSYISTKETGYPRAEMNNTGNLFAAYATAINYVVMRALNGTYNSPELEFSNGVLSAILGIRNNFFNFQVGGDLGIAASGILDLSGLSVRVPSWSKLVNTQTGQTLQQALDAKMNI